MSINHLLLPVKVHYLFFFGALAGTVPFLMRYILQLGVSPSVIGILYSSIPFVVMLAKPLLGSLADRFQLQKSVFLATLAMVTMGFFSVSFIPPAGVEQPVTTLQTVVCQSEVVTVRTCPSSGNASTLKHVYCDFSCWSSARICNGTSESVCPSESINATGKFTESGSISFGAHVLLNQSFEVERGCVEFPVAFNNDSFRFSPVFNYCDNFTSLSCSSILCLNGTSREPLALERYINITTDSLLTVSTDDSGTETVSITTRLIALWICMLVAYVGMGVAVSLADTITLNLLGDNKGRFGMQRLWGSVGWGGFSIVAGRLVDYSSYGKKLLDFSSCFYLTLVLGTIDMLVVSKINVVKTKCSKNIARNVGHMFLVPRVLLFGIAVFSVGFLTAMLWTFLIVYLNMLGANQLLIGLVLGVQCFLGELPFFFLSGWLLKKLGHGHSMTLVLFVFGVRFVLYSLIRDPWMVLPIELLNGVTYGIFFTALATFSSIIAPPGTSATMQGILQALFEGFGFGIGNLVGGFIYETFGGSFTFFICGCIAIGCSILHAVCLVLLRGQPLRSLPTPIVMTEIQTEDVEDGVGSKMLNSDGVIIS